jgi:hypothetical protein
MNNKKSLFFGLIEMNSTMFNVLYTFLVLVVLASTGMLMLIALALISKNIFCDEHLGKLVLLGLAMWIFIIWNVFPGYKNN